METFFKELKQARESKHISLSDISDATLINVHLLEEMERGNVGILPQTYVRAFLREYAAVVGLDPDAVLRNFEATLHTKAEPSPKATGRSRAPEVRPAEGQAKPQVTRWAIMIVVLAAFGIGLWNLLGHRPAHKTQEAPFQDVLKENERRTAPPVTPPPANAPTTAPAPGAVVDSLTLRGVTSDSVWVRLVIDDAPPREYLFKSGVRMSWKARNRFVVTLGKSGAIRFTLNAKDLGPLGQSGRVLRNVELNRQTLASIKPVAQTP